MLGNPVVNWKWDGDTVYIAASYFHSIYGNEIKNKIDANNCTLYYLDSYHLPYTEKCQEVVDKFFDLTQYINVYDVYRPCWGLYKNDIAEYGEAMVDGTVRTYKRLYTSKDYTPWLKAEPFSCTWD